MHKLAPLTAWASTDYEVRAEPHRCRRIGEPVMQMHLETIDRAKALRAAHSAAWSGNAVEIVRHVHVGWGCFHDVEYIYVSNN